MKKHPKKNKQKIDSSQESFKPLLSIENTSDLNHGPDDDDFLEHIKRTLRAINPFTD